MSKLFLGLDCSTQTLKASVIDENLKELIQYETIINYDQDLPHYKTIGGVIHGVDNVTKTTPTIVFIEALDLLLERLKNKNFPFQSVAAISGSGQQHGSVYWKKGALEILKNLNPQNKLIEQSQNFFSIANSPIWMDSSTT